jgi:hypothetical protein
MNSQQQQILEKILDDPVRSNILWVDVESLLRACGAEVTEGQGSRIRVALNGVRAVFHRPHPRPQTDKGAIKSIRRFLTEAGVTPDDAV